MPNKNGSNWIRKDLRYAIYHRDNFTCVYCGERFSSLPAKFRTLDHVIPRELGGNNRPTNLVTCCYSCNSRKQDRSIFEFLDPDDISRVTEQLQKPVDRKRGKYLLELAKVVA